MSARQAVVVTGASSGIGAATVAKLAACGFATFGAVRTLADAERLTCIVGVQPLVFDITDGEAIAVAARAVSQSGFALRAVVNNAGVAVAGPLEHLPLEDFRRQLEVNVVGALAVTQAFMPLLRASRGRAVFIGSISGRLAVPYIAPYSASKAALRALAAALRVELAPIGIRVILIEPGSVKTPIWRKGREGSERIRAVIGPRGADAYDGVIDALVRATEREEAAGMPAERVADAVLEAIRAARPRAEHLVGFSAHAGSIAAMLPAAWRDRVMVRSLRLPKHR